MPRVPIRRLPLAVEAAILLARATLRLRRHPPERTAAMLGRAQPARATDGPPSGVADEALRIGRAVEHVAAVLPWHPVCLPQAVAVSAMLRRRGIVCETHLGVTGVESPGAHAWVTVGGVVVQGAPTDGVTELASFR